jgi:type VI secretion system protein ImpH
MSNTLPTISSTLAESSNLADRVQAEPWSFQFRQAMRILTLDARNRGELLRDQLPEQVRFRTPATLSFPASELVSVEAEGDNSALCVSFMGLTGPSGILPTRYTELLIDRKNNFRDTTLHDFLDIFSHRAISLFYAASQKYRFYQQLELHNNDGFSRNLLDFAGVGLQGLRGRLSLTRDAGEADRFLMYHAGILAQKPISASGLETLVRGLLDVDVKLKSFQGTFIALTPENQSCLSSHNCELGVNTLMGERQYDCQTKAVLAIGPLQSKKFAELLPGGTAATALRELIRFCVGHTLAIDVELTLQHDCIPAPHLSQTAATPKQLGFNTWIRTKPIEQDRSDCSYMLQL